MAAGTSTIAKQGTCTATRELPHGGSVCFQTAIPTQLLTNLIHGSLSDCANDPSAGSPTETLLRLLLPLSDKVH